MPFDSTISLPALRRSILAEALRNDTEWKWNFCDTAGCALGMAAAIWPEQYEIRTFGPDTGPVRRAAEFFGLNMMEASTIFGNSPEDAYVKYGCDQEDVTPQMVADQLEKIA